MRETWMSATRPACHFPSTNRYQIAAILTPLKAVAFCLFLWPN